MKEPDLRKIELLAPAQNLEIGISAINFGADAVYIGANAFSARKQAGNSLFDIEKLVNYAHKYNSRVHIALNTILDDRELKAAKKLAFELYDIGVDALIIQDMGLIEAGLPDMELHASTQCNIRTLEKVKFLEKSGFSRAILARELSVDEIKNIKENTNIELETFIHGALCVSYSGQCYMSASIGERSANRGDCAQCCRKKYSLLQNDKTLIKNKYLLSLKDFCAEKYIDTLVSIGVKSFKIEGRLKDENYVKNAVLYYNNLLKKYERTSCGRVYSDFSPDINKTFNRKFTTYFLSGKREKIANFDTPKAVGEYIGKVSYLDKGGFKIKTDKKITAQDGLCFVKNGELRGFLVNKVEDEIVIPNKKVEINIADEIYRNKDVEFENKIKNSKTKRLIDINVEIYENRITARTLNNFAKIEFQGEIAKDNLSAKNSFTKAFSKTGNSIFKILNIDFKIQNVPYLPISKLNEIRRELFLKLEGEIIKNYKKTKGKKPDFAPYDDKNKDFRLNIYNEKAEEFYKKHGVQNIEYAPEKTKDFKNKELMRTKYCLRCEINMCLKNSKNKGALFLEDEKGERYLLKFDCKNCEMAIIKK